MVLTAIILQHVETFQRLVSRFMVSSSMQVSKLPRELKSVHQLCFSSDSCRLFASSSLSSVVVVALDQTDCKYLHTLKHKSGEFRWRFVWIAAKRQTMMSWRRKLLIG